MKLRILFSSLVALAAASPLYSAQVWAPGVYYDAATGKSGGWVDTDKDEYTSSLGTVAGMCWAASASNILTWWYGHNPDKHTTSTTASQNPWVVFQSVYNDDGWLPHNGLDWWINGIDDNTVNSYFADGNIGRMDYTCYNEKQPPYPKEWYYGGFLKSEYSETILVAQNPNHTDGRALSLNIIDAMEAGYALTLAVYNDAGNAAVSHAITLWGLAYEGEGDNRAITEMWVTDSDNPDGDGLRHYTLHNLNDPKVKENSLSFSGGQYDGATIGYVSGMRVDPIPEPTTTTLSLLALAGLAMRRRRK